MKANIIYLLLGILVKETIDELKAIAKQNADELERRKEQIATYRPNPALPAGSLEAHRAMCEAKHAADVAPFLKRLTRRQRVWKYLLLVVYLSLMVVLFWLADRVGSP